MLVSIDMMRADALKDAPRLRKFAKKAALYENAYSLATYTLPSHMTMMTGLDPFMHGAVENGAAYPKKAAMLAERLKGAGYDTAAFTDGFVDPQNFAAGFDAFRHREGDEFGKAEAWLAARKDARPFFLFVHTLGVHGHFRDEKGRRRSASEAYFNGELGLEKTYRASYAKAVGATDRAVSGLLEILPEGTAVIVTADHGENILEPHAGGDVSLEHTMPWEVALRVPLIVRAPGSAKGSKSSCFAHLDQIAPTIASWAGLPADGRPLDDCPDRQPPVFFLGRREGVVAGVRRGGAKLIVEFPKERARLFDVAADPGELKDLSAEKPELAAELRALLDEHFKDAGFDPRRPKPELDQKAADALRDAGYLQ